MTGRRLTTYISGFLRCTGVYRSRFYTTLSRPTKLVLVHLFHKKYENEVTSCIRREPPKIGHAKGSYGMLWVFKYVNLFGTFNMLACCELSVGWPVASFQYGGLLEAFNMLACCELSIWWPVESFHYVGLLRAFDTFVLYELLICWSVMSFWYVCLLWNSMLACYKLLLRLSVMSY